MPCWQALVASPGTGWGRLPGRGWQQGYQADIWSQPFPELAPQAGGKVGPSGWQPDEGGVVVQAESPRGSPAQRDGPLLRVEGGTTKAAFPPKNGQELCALP